MFDGKAIHNSDGQDELMCDEVKQITQKTQNEKAFGNDRYSVDLNKMSSKGGDS